MRPTVRKDNKLSDRSISGTFVGLSDKGNGYIFLINKANDLVEIDTKDAKFNETFADCRAMKGKLTAANNIEPDLRNEREKPDDDTPETKGSDSSSDNDDGDQRHERQQSEDDEDGQGDHFLHEFELKCAEGSMTPSVGRNMQAILNKSDTPRN